MHKNVLFYVLRNQSVLEKRHPGLLCWTEALNFAQIVCVSKILSSILQNSSGAEWLTNLSLQGNMNTE